MDKLFQSLSRCDDSYASSSLHIAMCGRAQSRVIRISVMKVRLDKLLLERGLAQSRERAQALILAGRVLVNDQKLEKPGAAVADDVSVRLLGDDLRYVSRGGLKLERAIQHWSINLPEKTCLDVGASTGGFTDCMLQHGAAHVIAVDTGYGQLDARLRQDSRVELLEKTNARYLRAEQLSREVKFFAIDVSFISVTLVLPAVIAALRGKFSNRATAFEGLILVKPQFEAGRERVGKGGIVRDEKIHLETIERVKQAALALGGREIEVIDSPILGAAGNREFLLHLTF